MTGLFSRRPKQAQQPQAVSAVFPELSQKALCLEALNKGQGADGHVCSNEKGHANNHICLWMDQVTREPQCGFQWPREGQRVLSPRGDNSVTTTREQADNKTIIGAAAPRLKVEPRNGEAAPEAPVVGPSEAFCAECGRPLGASSRDGREVYRARRRLRNERLVFYSYVALTVVAALVSFLRSTGRL